MILLWDEWNTHHIARHLVEQDEAAEVVQRASRPFPTRIGRDKFLIRGQTARGRYLQVVYVLRTPDTIRFDAMSLEERLAVEAGELIGYVIHSRDLEDGERRTLRRRSRQP